MKEKKFLYLFLMVLLLSILKKIYFENIEIFLFLNFIEIKKLYIFGFMFFLIYLIIKPLKYFYFRKKHQIQQYFLNRKRVKSFEKNVYNVKNEFKKVNNWAFINSYFDKSKVSILNKNFFSNRKNLLNKFFFLKILSKNDANFLNQKNKQFSLLNVITKLDFSSLHFNNNDSFLIKKRRKNYYTLLLIHFLILKLQKQELINSLNLDKKVGNYPFTLAYDEEVINFRRSKYFDYSSTELFFLLLYGLLEWFLVFYLIHLGLCIFYDINVFEIFFKLFETFLPIHFYAYSDYLKMSVLLNSIFFFFLLIYTLTDWVFELTDEVSTYQLPPKDWFVDVFLPTLQGILLFVIFALIFFLFLYNGYVILIILLYTPFEYFYNFTLGWFINIENLVVLITLFDINIFLKLFFLEQSGVIFNFYSPFFHQNHIFYKSLYNENFFWNYSSNILYSDKNAFDNQFYFFSIEYQNLLQLKIWKNELLLDLRKYNYFLQQENDILFIKDYVNKGFRGLGLRLDNQYFFKNIEFLGKNIIRHYRPNSENLMDSIISSKYNQIFKKELSFSNLMIMPSEENLISSNVLDFNFFTNNFNVVSNYNDFKKVKNNFFFKCFNYFNDTNLSTLNNLYIFPLDLNDFVNYKINSKFLYNDLIFENLNYFNDSQKQNIVKFSKLYNYILNAEFLPYVLPEHEKELLLLNLKIFNLNLDFCNTIEDFKQYIKETLIIGNFLDNKNLSKKFLNEKQLNDLSSYKNYSSEFYEFLQNFIFDNKNFDGLLLLNIEFLAKKQEACINDIYKDEILFLTHLIQSNSKNSKFDLVFSKINIKNDFIYPFFNSFFKPFYFQRNLDSLIFMPRISSNNNSSFLFFYDDENNLNYWWENFLLMKNRLLKYYANFPTIFSSFNRKNVIYLKNFGEKVKFVDKIFFLFNDNINEIKEKNFSSYYTMEIKIQNFSYFQNTLSNRYFHKFYDSTYVTAGREVSLTEYSDNFKNKLCFIPNFEQNNKRFFQSIFNINWKKYKDTWLEYPEQNYIAPYIQYSTHLLNFPEYFKLELDFSQAILDYESLNLFKGFRDPIFFTEEVEFNQDSKDSNVGFIIDRDLIRTYQFGDFNGVLLLKDYQTTLAFDKKNFFLNNFLYNLFIDKIYSVLYSLNANKLSSYKLTNINNCKDFLFLNDLDFKTSEYFIYNFKNFYNKTIQYQFYEEEFKILPLDWLFLNFLKQDSDRKKSNNFIKIFIPFLDIENIYFIKYLFNNSNFYTKQEELNGIFERINIKLSDFISRLIIKKKNVSFFNNYFVFLNLKNYLKVRSIDPWELYLFNKNSNVYDALICNEEFLFTELPYDDIIENSKNKLLNLEKLTYLLTPYRLNYKGFRGFGILRKDITNYNFRSIIAFYLNKENYLNFELKNVNKKLQKNLIDTVLENFKNKMYQDLTDELSYEIGITPPLGRKLKFMKMDYRVLHFTNSKHLLVKSKLFSTVFYRNKIDPYLFCMFNFPYDNEFSRIWSTTFHNVLLSNQILEKIRIDRIFGKEIINNQSRFKRIFFFKYFQNFDAIDNEQENLYYNNIKKKFNIIFNLQQKNLLSKFFLNNSVVNLNKINNFFLDKTFWYIESSNFQIYYNQYERLNELDFLLILKDYIPFLFDFFYMNINIPYYDWFVNDEWVSKRFRKYGFRLFKTYRTFYFKDERFPLSDYISRHKIKRMENIQILEKPQLKRKKFTKKQYIYHDHKLLIYKFIPVVRPRMIKSINFNSRWVFITNKVKPTPTILILKNNEIRSNKIKSYLFFLQNLANPLSYNSGCLFWLYFLNSKQTSLINQNVNYYYNFNLDKSFCYSYNNIGKLLIFNTNGLYNNKLFLFSKSYMFKFYIHLNRYLKYNNFKFSKDDKFFFLKKLLVPDFYNLKLDLFENKKIAQFKYLSRFLSYNDNRDYHFLNFYTPQQYFLYNNNKWNSWLLLNKYRNIEEHYIQYNLNKDKTFPLSVNDGNDFNIKEIEESERMDQPFFLSNPAATNMQLNDSDDLPFSLISPKKYYIPYIHEKWYYSNLYASHLIDNKKLKFYSFYNDFYFEIRDLTLVVLKKKIQFNFFQIQKIYYLNNLLYKYHYKTADDVNLMNFDKKFFFYQNSIFYLKFFLNFIKYEFLYFNNLTYYKFIFYFLFLREIPLIGFFLTFMFNFFLSLYIFFFNLFIFYLFPFFINFVEIIFIDFIEFFRIINKIYFHPFWIFILYFFWIIYYYILSRVYSNSREPYNFKNLFAYFDWDEKVYYFNLMRRKIDTKSFFETMHATNALFLKNAKEFHERDKTLTMKDIEKLNVFSYEQEIFRRKFLSNQRFKNYWFVKFFTDYEIIKNEDFELNFTRQSNSFIFNYFKKPMAKLILNTNYISKVNFIFNNNNIEKLKMKYYSDLLLKDFARHGSDTSEFGRFRWLYNASILFFQFLLFIFIIAFFVFLII